MIVFQVTLYIRVQIYSKIQNFVIFKVAHFNFKTEFWRMLRMMSQCRIWQLKEQVENLSNPECLSKKKKSIEYITQLDEADAIQ